ncbi:hypothetical protein IQ244_15255 [Nostoc sp. LEGE 06077]|uniref:hypothetical protein n=1 Tax=Nostoc sp. LEGE 06077 TaxID=915325 RepID=UPI001880F1BC|nr:hypothetical protein [Nostoc sp. LEGE 06077]MBE9207854.1 hypothetical protein [Nostoc sp. LEGE 06077]
MPSILVNFYRQVLPAVAMSVVGVVAFSSATWTAPVKTQLLSRKCTTSGYIGRRQRDVSIGREVYTSQFNMITNSDEKLRARVACDITKPQPGAFKTLYLEMGIDDAERERNTVVTIFFNGKEVFNEAITKGPIKKLSLDVRNVRSATVEVWTSDRFGVNSVHFVKAELLK